MRSLDQSWFMGTSENFNGNQLYIADETFNQTRFSIQPNGGPINMQGNTTQNISGYGLPKAMTNINGDGTIIRCYNGITSSSSGGCGITASKFNPGSYKISFGFSLSNRFFSLAVNDDYGRYFQDNIPIGISYQVEGDALYVYIYESNRTQAYTDRPFMIIVY
jgi:hypothetical protein